MTLSWGLAPVVSVLRIVISISFCCGVSADSPLGPWPCARAVRRTHTLTHLHIHVHGVSNASLGRCKACPSTVVSRPKNGTLKALSGARNTDTKVAHVGRLRPKHIWWMVVGARPVGPQTGRASRAPLDSGCAAIGRGVPGPRLHFVGRNRPTRATWVCRRRGAPQPDRQAFFGGAHAPARPALWRTPRV